MPSIVNPPVDKSPAGSGVLPLPTKEGNGSIFGRLILPHEHTLRAFVQRRIAGAEDAADICQEVLLRAYLMVDTFEKKSSSGTWLLSIAHHVVIDHYRKTKSREFLMNSEEAVRQINARPCGEQYSVGALVDARERIERCLRCITTNLSVQEQVSVLLCEVYAVRDSEAARAMHKSVGSFKHLLHSARATLQRSCCTRCALVFKSGIPSSQPKQQGNATQDRTRSYGSKRRGFGATRLTRLRNKLLTEILFFNPHGAERLAATSGKSSTLSRPGRYSPSR